MAFTAKDVSALRERTGCGMMDCKKALTASDGDMEKAIEFLREKGYAGDYLVEVDGFAGDPEQACRTSYEFLRGKLV